MGENTSKKKENKIHLGDGVAIKRAIDEQAVEALKIAGYDIDHTMTDLKLGIGIVACIVACVAQFWPGPLKNSPIVIAPCVGSYMVLSLVLWFMQSFVQKNVIASTKEHPGTPAIHLESTMAKYSDQYTLKAVMKGESVAGSKDASMTQSVGMFFTEDAEILKENINGMLNELLHKLDAPSESSNGNKKDS